MKRYESFESHLEHTPFIIKTSEAEEGKCFFVSKVMSSVFHDAVFCSFPNEIFHFFSFEVLKEWNEKFLGEIVDVHK